MRTTTSLISNALWSFGSADLTLSSLNKTMATLILSFALAGLGCETSHVDEHWGEAYHAAVARQTAEPEAAVINADEPSPRPLDGATNDAVQSNYIKNQEATTAPKSNALAEIFGVGGSN